MIMNGTHYRTMCVRFHDTISIAFIGMAFFSVARIYQSAFISSSRLEKSKFILCLEPLIRFDGEIG